MRNRKTVRVLNAGLSSPNNEHQSRRTIPLRMLQRRPRPKRSGSGPRAGTCLRELQKAYQERISLAEAMYRPDPPNDKKRHQRQQLQTIHAMNDLHPLTKTALILYAILTTMLITLWLGRIHQELHLLRTTYQSTLK